MYFSATDFVELIASFSFNQKYNHVFWKDPKISMIDAFFYIPKGVLKVMKVISDQV